MEFIDHYKTEDSEEESKRVNIHQSADYLAGFPSNNYSFIQRSQVNVSAVPKASDFLSDSDLYILFHCLKVHLI